MARACLLMAVCGVLPLRSGDAWAVVQSGQALAEPEARLHLDLPGGSLDAALKALALRSGIQILYAPGQVESRRARPLRGRMTLEHALRYLLEGSELQAERVNADTFVLKAIAAPAPARAPLQAAPETPQGPVEIARVEVTGSRIPRIDIDAVTPSPMTLITRDDIEASGFQTLFELLRFQPGMIGHHPVAIAADGGPSFQQPFNVAATTSLNALGPRATLFLVDGRRVANYGLTSSELGGLTDLDVIPLSLVERVEILRGGASAIYGADAMAGVVNIILRKQQKGGEALARYGRSGRGDADERRISLSHGIDTPRGGSGILAVDWLDREALPGDARDWHSRDHRREGLFDWRYPLGYFVDGRLVSLQCGNAPADVALDCRFDPARYTDLQPASRRLWLYGHVAEPLWEGATFEFDARYSEARQELEHPPFHASVTLPAGHPDSLEDGSLNYVFFELGPVVNRSRNRSLDLDAAVKGWHGEWAWDVSLSHHENRVTSRIDGQVSNEEIERSVFLDRYRFDGTPNDPAILDTISPTFTLHGEATLQQLSAGLEGPLFALPGGEARLAVGGEFIRNGLVHRPDARLLDDDLALGTPKTALDSHRNSGALYTELGLPLLDNLQAELALRFDAPQGYDNRFSPKLGLKWSPRDTLTLRATAATGYRVPSLFELRRPNVIEERTFVLQTDELGPCADELALTPSRSLCLVTLGALENPDLEPETSRSHTLGIVWAPSPDFSLSFDHFRIRRNNEILPGSAFDDLAAFPDSLRRNADGQLVAIDRYFENVGVTDVRGWEAEMRWHLDAGDAGDFSLVLAAHHLSRVDRRAWDGAPIHDHAGYGSPNGNLLGSLQWRRGDWTSTLGLRARGPYWVGSPDTGCPRFNGGRCRTPGRGVLDIDVAYNGIPGWRLGVNVRDLADRDPVNYDTERDGYDVAYDDPRGRYVLLSARHRF
ncbi:TonB-dependent receptor [Marilutibacter chinensis]|uniref:TonB-dependent receptor n=1 Tax=Marilutibacter chinensis TaxID=2912247 RepID=A0ABS9HVB3_9GAMM|nr:TonB-dependent receptor [Lysobacter chinensis]MCF7222658.1 TonB-dependent receptor [Lysobacter chinensis]